MSTGVTLGGGDTQPKRQKEGAWLCGEGEAQGPDGRRTRRGASSSQHDRRSWVKPTSRNLSEEHTRDPQPARLPRPLLLWVPNQGPGDMLDAPESPGEPRRMQAGLQAEQTACWRELP